MKEIDLEIREKLEYIHHVLQECMNNNNQAIMLETALEFVEDIREPYFESFEKRNNGLDGPIMVKNHKEEWCEDCQGYVLVWEKADGTWECGKCTVHNGTEGPMTLEAFC